MADSKRRRLDYTRRWKAAKRLQQKQLQENVLYMTSTDSEQSSDGYISKPTVLEQSHDSQLREHSHEHDGLTQFEKETKDQDGSTGSEDEEVWDVIDHCNDLIISSDADGDSEDSTSPRDDIALWANQHLITHNALDDILKVLGKHGHSDLLAAAQTLLQTPQNVEIDIESGVQCISL